ncbi:MAG: hypothetical protein ACI9NY_001735 [Kiritimatiellia bacterium]|jgi:hypothetical protein
MESHSDGRLRRSAPRRFYENRRRQTPTFINRATALISLGSKSGNGGVFKQEALKLAGWNGGELTTYASRAQLAAEVFNRIREVLNGTESAEELKEKLEILH